MKKMVEKLFHYLTANRFEFRNGSYSQEGEDLFLLKYFSGKRNGSFVDIGAHHPKRLSNTYLFYRLGWRGLNIDALPGSMQAFKKERPGDVNLELGVNLSEGEMTFYTFNEPALNTFSEKEAYAKSGNNGYEIVGKHSIYVRPLKTILEKHWDRGFIDFMSVDVEGLDLQVLQSNDWQKYRPQVVLVEDLQRGDLLSLNESELVRYMLRQNYLPIGRTYSTLFFEDQTV